MNIIRLGDQEPTVDEAAWVASTAIVAGSAVLGSGVSVWYGAVLRADGDRIVVGEESNLQDGCVLHADPGLPVTIGRRVSVGHRAVLHGCTVADDVLVGMSATVLNGARIGPDCIIAAGTVVLEDAAIPAGSLVAGMPGRARRETTEVERAKIRQNARTYLDLQARHAKGQAESPVGE